MGTYQETKSIARECSRILHLLRVRGGRLLKSGDDWVIETSSSSAFGRFTLAPVAIDNEESTVTIGSGRVRIGTGSPVSVAETAVEVTGGTQGSPHFAVLEFTKPDTAEIVSTATSEYPVSDETTFRVALCEVYKSGDTVRVGRICHYGDIVIWGAFA